MKSAAHPCISVVAPRLDADEISFLLADLGALAIEQRDESTMTASASDKAELIAGFKDKEARRRAAESLEAMSLQGVAARLIEVSDDGWSERWKEFFKPIELSRIRVAAPWMEPAACGLETIVIDPGQAFGTGGHATTRLVLQMLEKRAKESKIPFFVLDVGAGSGVLSIAAAKLGAGKVSAIDIDEESVSATLNNARANGVADRIDAMRKPAREIEGRWPLVLANLDAATFLEESRFLARNVETGGEILMSGLLDDQVDRIVGLWPGFDAKERLSCEGWSGIALEKVR